MWTPEITKYILGDAIHETIKAIFDPEIPVNIYELGLINEIKVDDESKAYLNDPKQTQLPGNLIHAIKSSGQGPGN